jgi:hypothetical protein
MDAWLCKGQKTILEPEWFRGAKTHPLTILRFPHGSGGQNATLYPCWLRAIKTSVDETLLRRNTVVVENSGVDSSVLGVQSLLLPDVEFDFVYLSGREGRPARMRTTCAGK